MKAQRGKHRTQSKTRIGTSARIHLSICLQHAIGMNRQELNTVVDGLQEDLVELTCDLIRFPTLCSTAQSYPEITRFINGKLVELGIEVQTIEVPREKLVKEWGENLEKSKKYIAVEQFGQRSIVLGHWKGQNDHPSLHLNTHYDVAGARGNPFEPEIRDGKIFGKGASNPKSDIACMITAVRALKKARTEFKGDLYLSFCPDADLGGDTGAGYLVEKGLGKSDMVIASFMGGTDTITLGCKGDLWFEITAYGKRVHSSEPDLGINPIAAMVKVEQAIIELDQKFKSGSRSRWTIVPSESSRPTVSICKIFTEGHFIPDKCVMHVNRRVSPDETMDQARQEFLETLKRVERENKDLKLSVEEVHTVDNPVASTDSLLVKTLSKNIRDIVGVEPKEIVRAWYTDGRLFSTGWNSQTVNYGPGRDFFYFPGDYVSIQDLVSATKVLAHTVLDLIGEDS